MIIEETKIITTKYWIDKEYRVNLEDLKFVLRQLESEEEFECEYPIPQYLAEVGVGDLYWFSYVTGITLDFDKGHREKANVFLNYLETKEDKANAEEIRTLLEEITRKYEARAIQKAVEEAKKKAERKQRRELAQFNRLKEKYDSGR